MNDLISREATVSILRARADMALGDVKDAASFFDYCANMIEKIPAVDAVPVVDAFPVTRCKDCVFMGHPIVAKDFRKDAGWCMSHGHIVLPNDFCSDAEPMEDEDE